MNARWSSINIADLATFLRQRGSLFVAATLCLSFAACAGVNAPKIPDSPQVDNNTPDKPTIGKGVAKKHQADNPEIAPTVDSQSANEHLVVYVEKKLADGKTQRMEADGWYYDYDAAKNKEYNGYLWKHERISKLLSGDVNRAKAVLRPGMKSDKRVIAANATIGLSRSEGAKHLKPLLQVTRNSLLPVNVRRAAIETLFSFDDKPAVRDARQEIAESFRKLDANHVPELHTEVLRHYLKVADVAQARDLINEALECNNAELKLEALRAVADHAQNKNGFRVHGLIDDEDPRVRAAALDLLDLSNTADVHNTFHLRVLKSVGDTNLEVRLAAVRAIGRTEGSLSSLRSYYARENPRMQTEILRALTTAKDLDFVFQQIEAEQWQVRIAIAEALAAPGGSNYTAAADRLLNDESGEVRLRAIASIATWEPALSGDLLFRAAHDNTAQRTRQAAIQAIAEQVMPSSEVESYLANSNSKTLLADLRGLWTTSIERTHQPQIQQVSHEYSRQDVTTQLNHHHAHQRVRGCEYLASHPNPKSIDRLLELANDPDDKVARAALWAIGTNGNAENLDFLGTKLSSDDHLSRVNAAYALARLGSNRGVAALNRYTRDKDPAVQIQTLNAMAELRNPLFAAAVLPMLDGPTEIQEEVLRALPDILGPETASSVVNPRLPHAIQVGRWRKWFETGGKWGPAQELPQEDSTPPMSARRTSGSRSR